MQRTWLGVVLLCAGCRGPAPEQPKDAAEHTPAPEAAPPEPVPAPKDRFAAFFETFCAADDAAKVAMLSEDFIGQAHFVAGDQDPATMHEAAGLLPTDVGTRVIVPAFPMCEEDAPATYAVAPSGLGTARIDGHPYRVAFDLEPLRLRRLLLTLPPDPTADAPAPPTVESVHISTMQLPDGTVPAALQRTLDQFLAKQRVCLDAYAATTQNPVGASVDLVLPTDGAPFLSARTIADLGVLACFEARLGSKRWPVATEQRLLLHYGIPVSGPPDGDDVVEMVGPR
ncbi:MAG: hypothetical protein AAGA54_14610 [Myxococcota bacterium]